ncbi:IclR family transcriptional regulator [Haloechinothrix sp. LS1_15]|nr:IclR family transcriptional regulator [Haloechinothrix sp. LS1_15]
MQRALAVLRAVESADDSVSVTELAQRTGLTVSTTHRLARALTEGSLLSQDPRSERYRLGPGLVALGRNAAERLGYNRALPALQELSQATGESVNLGVRAGNEVHVILDAASHQPLRFDQASGTRVPIHTSAMGKCLLAFTGDISETIEQLGELVAVTDRTITDPQRLYDELHLVRQRGWALNDEERNAGVRAVGAPVLGQGGHVLAAVALQGPTVRVTDDRLPELVRALQQVTAQIAPMLIGYSDLD